MNEKAELIIEVNAADYLSAEDLKLAESTNQVVLIVFLL